MRLNGFLILALVYFVECMRLPRPWTSQHWCESIFDPHWPYAYEKIPGDVLEPKGRTALDQQHLGHECTTRGAKTKCHICDDIKCDVGLGGNCTFQLQGVLWDRLPKNIPTVSDSPWAIGGSHRYDFGNADRVCLLLAGEECIEHNHTDYSDCPTRCWGVGNTIEDEIDDANSDDEIVGWQYDKSVGNPQGKVETLAGTGVKGDVIGDVDVAQFSFPQGLDKGQNREVIVADTGNHKIKMIDPFTRQVTLIAGTGEAGHKDGDASLAQFSSPTSVSVYYEGGTKMCIVVADTDNNRIRLIKDGFVTTLAGQNLTGYADGAGDEARFDHPRGVAATPTGEVYVADSYNHLIRKIATDGTVTTIAGTTVEQFVPGCPPPCHVGVAGYEDSTALESKFHFPSGVSLGLDGTVLVTDGHRLRRVTMVGLGSVIQGVTSQNRVVTVAGSVDQGNLDGNQEEARFFEPSGVTMTGDGRMYVADTIGCRIRRVSSAEQVAQEVTCSTRVIDIVKPSGCQSYDPPVSAVNRKSTAMIGNVFYNHKIDTKDGRTIKGCQGSPPPLDGTQSNTRTLGPYMGTGYQSFSEDEDVNEGTTIRVNCPPSCLADTSKIYGTSTFTDTSSICRAALHEGVINDTGGLVLVTLTAGSSAFTSRLLNGVTSEMKAEHHPRTFTVAEYPLANVEVHTIAGPPSAPLLYSCGFKDTQPPQESKFDAPTDIAVLDGQSLTDTETLVIADSHNHRIRIMTATCSMVCENGGTCVGPDKCSCPVGWSGVDCATPVCSTACGDRQVCVGPDTCACIPGYEGINCNTPLCVQDCGHGTCIAPDTCSCTTGWMDANCTTPVCSHTCGNGGDCIAPDTCRCEDEWMGTDCREPVCRQTCLNGGSCIAPDTCRCSPEWSGHDCSKPVCRQGFFLADVDGSASSYYAPSTTWGLRSKISNSEISAPISGQAEFREDYWYEYRACDLPDWCDATNEFDCAQVHRQTYREELSNKFYRSQGELPPDYCFPIELSTTASTWYRYEQSDKTITSHARISDLTPYGWGPSSLSNPWSSPSVSDSDRQVAWAELRKVAQGVYVCANGGDCTAPDTCKCAPGWIGFDCRIPICNQGYYEPTLTSPKYTNQGQYECSRRSLTIWEHPSTVDGKFDAYVHEHPNFFSLHMDDSPLTSHTGNEWPATHEKSDPTDNVVEGWRRPGVHTLTGTEWQKGLCTPEYQRVCPTFPEKGTTVSTGEIGVPVLDTDASFRADITQTNVKTIATGRWWEEGGECTDHVLRGCFNGGTCVAPDTCECATGWEGKDCSIPICEQNLVTEATYPNSVVLQPRNVTGHATTGIDVVDTLMADGTTLQWHECPNRGNCTNPGICTCEKGWGGVDCTTPLCAQECLHGGKCVLPDLCECTQEPNSWRDARENGGRPLFRTDEGDPQPTGYTGYDCGTPICTQGDGWLSNDIDDVTQLVKTSTAGESFQGGCIDSSDYIPDPGFRRKSQALCNVEQWYYGLYDNSFDNGEDSFSASGRQVLINYPNYIQVQPDSYEEWIKGETIYGEGIYACYNKGSCTAPDVCECSDGWSGTDCNTPLCRHKNTEDPSVPTYGKETGCMNGGICSDKDTCTCITLESIIHQAHPDEYRGTTGWTGTDCSIPICIQGWFDSTCMGVSLGGEGCYRCPNGGTCVGPDTCECADGWQGHDCRTPVCAVNATVQDIYHLATVDDAKVLAFETDPCGMATGKGSCVMPNRCQCTCNSIAKKDEDNDWISEAWQDPILHRSLDPGFIYGTRDCVDGFEGNMDSDGVFVDCLYTIKVPSFIERYTIHIILFIIFLLIAGFAFYFFMKRRLRQRWLRLKAERRRSEVQSQRSSRRAGTQRRGRTTAFGHT